MAYRIVCVQQTIFNNGQTTTSSVHKAIENLNRISPKVVELVCVVEGGFGDEASKLLQFLSKKKSRGSSAQQQASGCSTVPFM